MNLKQSIPSISVSTISGNGAGDSSPNVSDKRAENSSCSTSFAGRTALFPQSGHCSGSEDRLKRNPQLSQTKIISITAYSITEEVYFFKDVISIEPTYPALDRAAFLIERTCVPRYYPPIYCAEAAQLLAMLDAARQKNEATGSSGRLDDYADKEM